jgi:fatty acid desaturase (delta-4 desaturase)
VSAFAGRDATEAFLSYHRRKFPHSKWADSLVGSAASRKDAAVDKDFIELCEIIDKVLPRSKSFAPLSYYIKISCIIFCAVGLEVYIHTTQSYVWYLTALEGFFMALIGLNIQHDANHGAVSRNPTVNRVLGLLQNYIGGSSLDWIHQHVVQVDAHTLHALFV